MLFRSVRQYSYSDKFQLNWEDEATRSIRNIKYKYMKIGTQEFFFDLELDPLEKRNKISSTLTDPEKAALNALKTEMAALLASR